MKLKDNLAAKEYEQNLIFLEEQKKLHHKHKIKNENVVVVEKSSAYKVVGTIFRTLITIILFIFATIGLLCIIYPSPRYELSNLLDNIWTQFTMFF